MTNTKPFNRWIFNFFAVFGFFPISTKKNFRILQCCTIIIVAILMFVIGFEFKFYIDSFSESPLYEKLFMIECKCLLARKKMLTRFRFFLFQGSYRSFYFYSFLYFPFQTTITKWNFSASSTKIRNL